MEPTQAPHVKPRYPRRGDHRRDKTAFEYLWSPSEVRTLRNLWPDIDTIQERLGRPRLGVRMKGARLGLPAYGVKGRPWSKAELAYACSTRTTTEVMRLTGRTREAVKAKRHKLRNPR